MVVIDKRNSSGYELGDEGVNPDAAISTLRSSLVFRATPLRGAGLRRSDKE